MRAMRILTAAALVLVASTAAAQGGQAPQGGQQGGGNRQNELLFKDITLTPEQQAKIDTIQAKSREESRALMTPGTPPDSTMRAKMAEVRTKSMAAIRAVLTPEQQPVFDKNLAAMPPMGGGRRPPTLR
jgi:Spy/CpxP family protein refolding chaperone